MMDDKRMRCAIVPGSFDPITVGHIDVLKRAAALYDKVYLALLINPDKKYLFDTEARIEIARLAIKDIPNAEVVYSDGMLYALARKLSCSAIIKGIRNETDLAYEMKMALYNRSLAPEIETLFLPCDDKLAEISSTLVRSLLSEGKESEAKKILPCGAIDIIKKRGFSFK